MNVHEPRIGAGADLCMLLVEDSQDDAEFVLDELRQGGYRVEYMRVDTLERLRAALPQRSWQLVLCDFALPQFDALDVLALLHEVELDVPVIVISGAVGEETAIRLMKAGAHDFLLKSNLSRLVPAIARELRDAAVRAERTTLREQLLLSDRLVQVGTLAAGVAHEINNPLAYVMGNIEYALRTLSSPLRESSEHASVIEALTTALEGARRIQTTTEDLRVFSRIGDGQPHPVQLRRVLESAIAMAATQIRHRARLIKDFEDLPPIAASENRIGQVFLNLLINAAQAIPEGHSADNEIRVRLHRAGRHAEIEISDTGAGIPAEIRKRLFQPFVTTKPKEVGTGLGLSICRRIVLEYGGEINARANAGRGTTFVVRLPLGAALPAETTPVVAGVRATTRSRLLVIDDEPEVVAMIRRDLCTEHDVVGVTSAQAALSLFVTDAMFDVILCDVMMPGLDGIQLYAEMKRAYPALAQRIVFMTGGAFTEPARQFLAAAPNAYITKPFDADILRRAVRAALARTAQVEPWVGAAC